MDWARPILITSNTGFCMEGGAGAAIGGGWGGGGGYSQREKGESQLSVFALLPGPQ